MKVATHRGSEQLPKTRCEAENSSVPLPAHPGHGHTNTAAPSLCEGGCRRHHPLCSLPIFPSGSNTTSVTHIKGLSTNSFSTWEETMLSHPEQRCSSLQLDESSRNKPAKRMNQWQSKAEAIKELQIWVNQGTHCADLDFHPGPGYSVDCWKAMQRSSLPGWSGSTRRQPEQPKGRVQGTSGLPRGSTYQLPLSLRNNQGRAERQN